MARVQGVPQLFILRNSIGHIFLMLAKITDDLLLSGSGHANSIFIEKIKARFKISKAIVEEIMSFNGCMVNRSDDEAISMNMTEYISVVEYIDLERGRRKESDFKAS